MSNSILDSHECYVLSTGPGSSAAPAISSNPILSSHKIRSGGIDVDGDPDGGDITNPVLKSFNVKAKTDPFLGHYIQVLQTDIDNNKLDDAAMLGSSVGNVAAHVTGVEGYTGTWIDIEKAVTRGAVKRIICTKSKNGKIFQRPSGSFITDGFVVGEEVACERGRDSDHYKVSIVTATQLTVTKLDNSAVSFNRAEIDVPVVRGHKRLVSKTINGNTLVLAGGNFITDGVVVGDIARIIADSENGGLERFYKITNVTSSTITVTRMVGTAISWSSTQSNIEIMVFKDIGEFYYNNIHDEIDLYVKPHGKRYVAFLEDKSFISTYHALPLHLRFMEYIFDISQQQHGAARFHPLWRTKFSLFINNLQTEFDGHENVEGFCTEETAMLAPANPVDSISYTLAELSAAWKYVLLNTSSTRKYLWLLWSINYFGSPSLETAEFKDILDDVVSTGPNQKCHRVALGGPNLRMYPYDDFKYEINAYYERVFPPGKIYYWAHDNYTGYKLRWWGAQQPSEYAREQYTGQFRNSNPRDLYYNFDRSVCIPGETGRYGDDGAFDWGHHMTTLTWYYNTSQTSGSNFRSANNDNNIEIISDNPTWYKDGITPFSMNSYAFPGTFGLKRQSSTTIDFSNPQLANSNSFVFSTWIKMDGSSINTNKYRIFEAANSTGVVKFSVNRNTSGGVSVYGESSSGVVLINKSSAGGVLLNSSGWKCLTISGNKALNKLFMYFHDTQLYNGTWTSTADVADFVNCVKWSMCSGFAGEEPFFGTIGNLRLSMKYCELNYEPYRRGFSSVTGKPLYLDYGRRPDIFSNTEYDLTLTNHAYNKSHFFTGNPITAAQLDTGTFTANKGAFDSSGTWSKVGTGAGTDHISAGVYP